MIRERVSSSRGVLVPLAVAFLVFWLGHVNIGTASSRYPAVEPVKPKPKTT